MLTRRNLEHFSVQPMHYISFIIHVASIHGCFGVALLLSTHWCGRQIIIVLLVKRTGSVFSAQLTLFAIPLTLICRQSCIEPPGSEYFLLFIFFFLNLAVLGIACMIFKLPYLTPKGSGCGICPPRCWNTAKINGVSLGAVYSESLAMCRLNI